MSEWGSRVIAFMCVSNRHWYFRLFAGEASWQRWTCSAFSITWSTTDVPGQCMWFATSNVRNGETCLCDAETQFGLGRRAVWRHAVLHAISFGHFCWGSSKCLRIGQDRRLLSDETPILAPVFHVHLCHSPKTDRWHPPWFLDRCWLHRAHFVHRRFAAGQSISLACLFGTVEVTTEDSAKEEEEDAEIRADKNNGGCSAARGWRRSRWETESVHSSRHSCRAATRFACRQRGLRVVFLI